MTERRKGLKRFFSKKQAGKEVLILSDEELRKRLMEKARTAKELIEIFTTARLGNPYFDSIPEQIKIAPPGINFRAIIVVPETGLQEDDPAYPILESIQDAIKERLDHGNGPAQVRLVKRSKVPPDFQRDSELIDQSVISINWA